MRDDGDVVERRGVVERDGLVLPWAVRGAALPQLLYVHGVTATGIEELDLLAPLTAAGWTVATLDQRGHGGATPVVDADLYDYRAMAADLAAVLDALGWLRPWVGAGSMGCAPALHLALTAPERVSGLVFLGPAVSTPNPEVTAQCDAIADAIESGTLPPAGTSAAELRQAARWTRSDPASLAAALRAVTRWDATADLDRLREIKVRVIVVAWPDDPIHPLGLAERIAAGVRHGWLEVVDPASAIQDPSSLWRAALAALGARSRGRDQRGRDERGRPPRRGV